MIIFLMADRLSKRWEVSNVLYAAALEMLFIDAPVVGILVGMVMQ